MWKRRKGHPPGKTKRERRKIKKERKTEVSVTESWAAGAEDLMWARRIGGRTQSKDKKGKCVFKRQWVGNPLKMSTMNQTSLVQVGLNWFLLAINQSRSTPVMESVWLQSCNWLRLRPLGSRCMMRTNDYKYGMCIIDQQDTTDSSNKQSAARASQDNKETTLTVHHPHWVHQWGWCTQLHRLRWQQICSVTHASDTVKV